LISVKAAAGLPFGIAIALACVSGIGRARAAPDDGTAGGGAALYRDARAPLEERVQDLLARLTVEEKIALMAGGSTFATQPLARLGIPVLNLSDGPNGVRSNNDRPATVFPTGSALAATWNPAVLTAVGEAIGREALAMNVHVMLGPDVNIQRSPLAGRNFEAYSEDPYLAGRLGVAFVRGVQSQGVGTSVKHFVANEQELERLRSSSNLDERTLREIYLLPFEIIVKQAQPWTVMASYNRLNGTYMTENGRLIRDVLKGEWAFDGLLMSDWGAVHSTVATAEAGVDLEMPGPPRYFGPLLVQAEHNFQIEPATIDAAARRVLRTIIRAHALDGPRPSGELLSPRNHATAVVAAREAITLLKNEHGTLPLARSRLRTLAVIGPNADVPLYQGGGSASVIPSRLETPLMSVRAVAGSAVKVLYAQGVDNDTAPPPADGRLLSPTAARSEPGLVFSYYGNAVFQGKPVRTGVERYFDKTLFASDLQSLSARWEGFLWPPRTGEYELSLNQIGSATLYLDGRAVLGEGIGVQESSGSGLRGPARVTQIHLQSGRSYRVKLDYTSPNIPFHSLRLGIRLPPGGIDEAVRIAKSADAALVFVGSSRSSETEGRDRDSMELPGRQNELVKAVLAANPNTTVVLNSGAPLALPWVEQAPAIVEALLAGEGGPEALAQILFGEANPSGKLPFTFPKRLEDNPAYLYYSGGRDAYYGEGVFVGYRYYDTKGVEPLFPFGHGLSYTRFEYANLRVPPNVAVGGTIDVAVDVRNAGATAGAETVQLYVGDEVTRDVVRPSKELKAFQKVQLAPGEVTTVRFTLSGRDLAYYDEHRRDWVSTPGTHRIFVGSSSRDIRLRTDFEWAAQSDSRRPGPQSTAPL
jgi:beta-glucosidase